MLVFGDIPFLPFFRTPRDSLVTVHPLHSEGLAPYVGLELTLFLPTVRAPGAHLSRTQVRQ